MLHKPNKAIWRFFRCPYCREAKMAYTKQLVMPCWGHNCIRKCHMIYDAISREEYEREWGYVNAIDSDEVS